MKKDINLLNISEQWTHFWNGSLDTHNLLNEDYIRNHPSIIDYEMNFIDTKQYTKMKLEIIQKYGCKKTGKIISGPKAKECVDAIHELRAELAVKSLSQKDIFTRDQVNQIFNTVMTKAGELSLKWACPFRGFRFAINGGKSVNIKSASVNTLGFLSKQKTESFEDMVKRCMEQFAFYIFCYSDKVNAWRAKHSCSRNWEGFKKWWNIESRKVKI